MVKGNNESSADEAVLDTAGSEGSFGENFYIYCLLFIEL